MVVLLAFQSRVDRYMALRVQSAAIRIYEHLLQEDKEFRWTRYLAPILPIVMQNGSGRWTAPTCMRDLVRPRTLPAGHIVSLMIRTENIQGLDGAIPVLDESMRQWGHHRPACTRRAGCRGCTCGGTTTF